MCGICGVYVKDNLSEQHRKLIGKMNNILQHRGPDDQGEYFGENVALGHRRLSIIDLSAAGHQPMKYQNRYVMVYNGEIYNYLELREILKKKGYVFSTETDTEVIMAAYDCYGVGCFEMFNGMWSLAIWDEEFQELILSRDRFGVKPLYYYCDSDKIVFASEIKAILEDETYKREANDKVVFDYLSKGWLDHTNETFFRNVFRFPEGSYVKIKKLEDIFRPTCFCRVEFEQFINTKEEKKTDEEFRELFQNSVKLRMRADVPLGSCLSGGLDSSSIVCCMDDIIKKENLENKQYTFSYCASDAKLNEESYIDEVVHSTDVEPEYVRIESINLLEELDKLIHYQDEPFSTTGMYAGFCVYRRAGEKGVKVLLDGQGADEILCGYRKSRIYYLKKLIKERRFIIALKEFFGSMGQVKTSLVFKSGFKSDVNKILRILKIKEQKNVSDKYYNEEFLKNVKGTTIDNKKGFQYNDVYRISLPALLRYTDRNSMAFSVESRLPFLDYRMVEFCAKLPLNKKIRNGYSKAIMRDALLMPTKIRKRKDKLGFVTPEDKWIRENKKEFKQMFMSENVRANRFIDVAHIIEDWDDIIDKGKIPYFFRIICLERWMELFKVH